jgi:hypothetical protein
MSIDASKKTIAKLEDQIKKAKADLREKGAKLIESSGLLDLDIPEKDLKKELKALRDKLAKK